MAGCDTCPEMVLGVLRQECLLTLDQVRRIKNLVTILNRAIREVEGGLVAELERLISLIPDPPLFDLRELINVLTCPLTPQSFVTDLIEDALIRSEQRVSNIPMPARIPAQLTAFNAALVAEGISTTTLYRGVTGILLSLARQIDAVLNQIDELLDNLRNTNELFGWLFDILKQFMRELDRICDGSATFLIRLAMTSANAALVRTACPSLYEDGTLPYKAFVQEMSTFSFTGMLPSGIDDHLQPLMQPMAQIQAKIVGWQTAQLVLVV